MALAAPGSAGPGRARIATTRIGTLKGESAVIEPRAEFVLAGVQWSAPADASIEMRVRSAQGRWSPWVPASTQGHAPDNPLPAGRRFGEALWAGPSRAVQLRGEGAVEDVRLHLVAGEGAASGGAQAAASFALAQPVLDAGPGQPPIIARRAWAQGQAPPAHLAGYGTIIVAFVHHTVSVNGYSSGQVPAILRAIFDYHRYVRGYLDIAYNFLIDAEGRVWEGRAGGIESAVIGAPRGLQRAVHRHRGDRGLHGCGPAARRDALAGAALGLEALAARCPGDGPRNGHRRSRWRVLHPVLARTAGVTSPDRGHRDGDQTDCPGDALYGRLPAVRSRTAPLAGTPAQLTFVAPNAPVTAGAATTLTGALGLLDGTPLAYAPLEFQQLLWNLTAPKARTITLDQLQTAADGSWSTSMALETNSILRVLHDAAPASVADWNLIEVAPLIALQLQSTTPLEVFVAINPPKKKVTLHLYAAGQPDQVIATRKANGAGRFARVSFGSVASGDYVVIARTAADTVNAAGASQPLSVTVS